MAKDDLTCVNVAGNALVEFIERIAVAGGRDITVSQGDKGWFVTYKPPFIRGIKEDVSKKVDRKDVCLARYAVCDPTSNIPVCEACYNVYDCEKCAFFKAPLCSAKERAEANCEGDKAKCGDVCHKLKEDN